MNEDKLEKIIKNREDYYLSRFGQRQAKKADSIKLEEFYILFRNHAVDMAEEDFYQFLRNYGFLDSDDEATLDAINAGYLQIVPREVSTPYGDYTLNNIYVTGIGQVCIVEMAKLLDGAVK